ncbi:Rieske domain-containing protein-like [Mytilus trossulus]|uniref:Rieske domain-containing protein-like n=1 Tax=Mytilus trossulus TaxID=6551 RepID=UPI0030071A06
MAEPRDVPKPEVDEENKWRYVGEVKELNKKKCHHVHAKSGKKYDVALFCDEGKFYAISAWCSHMGGPLYHGQIEDYNGRCHVMCPWHSYMFDLKTGTNDLGLQQDIYEIKFEKGQLYIQHDSELSLGSYVITCPVK